MPDSAAQLAAMLPEDPTSDAPWQRAARGALVELARLRRRPQFPSITESVDAAEPIPDGGA